MRWLHGAERASRGKQQGFFAALKITQPPVPVERIARYLGAHVQFSPFDGEISGMIYIKDGIAIIGVNALHPPNRQRFTIGHECGHLVLHRHLITQEVHVDKKFAVLRRDDTSATGTERVEIEANRFRGRINDAAHALAPCVRQRRDRYRRLRACKWACSGVQNERRCDENKNDQSIWVSLKVCCVDFLCVSCLALAKLKFAALFQHAFISQLGTSPPPGPLPQGEGENKRRGGSGSG